MEGPDTLSPAGINSRSNSMEDLGCHSSAGNGSSRSSLESLGCVSVQMEEP